MRRAALILLPYTWLAALFLVPFLIVLKISLSDTALAIPPYTPTLDLSEGVRGISVRLVEVGTNRVVAQAFTDAQGFAQVEGATNATAQLVVPYFGEAWSVSSGRQGAVTLPLSPGNQPALLP